MRPLERLSLSDLTNLAIEAPDSPMHQGALAVMDGKGLLDADGRVRIHTIRRHIERRLGRAPELRQVLFRTGPLEGRPLWIDDPHFDIANHVQVATLPSPGGQQAALCFAEAAMAELMDRRLPLWEIWFLERYGGGKVGIFIKLHHALADGPSMLNMLAQLFEVDAASVEAGRTAWTPQPPPPARVLFADNVARKGGLLATAVRRILHPWPLLGTALRSVRASVEALRQGRGAPRTSLNRPIGPRRRVAVLGLPLDEVKAIGHARGVKLNDVFLDVVAGGLREVLAGRGELAAGRPIRASVAVSLHGAGDSSQVGNHIGTMIVPLPVDEPDAVSRLAAIAAATQTAKRRQQAAVPPSAMAVAGLALTGLTRFYIRRQHMINILATNLPGPPVPLYFAGARIEDAIAIPPIAGNVTASFAALSYLGTLNLSVYADADAWPDLNVLMAGMRTAWQALAAPSSPPATLAS